MATTTFPYSTFLRSPSQVLLALEESIVLLERRDDANLILMREEAFDAKDVGLQLMARAFASLNRRHPELAEELLADELPWLHWLPEDERPQCVRQLLADLAAGADTGLMVPFIRTLRGWRNTAEIWSDPELTARLSGPFTTEESVPLERPKRPEAP
ncbi:hypothetical protein [Catenulispora subtropica]|uniref:Uncharacterized protein n=1 Tax=Catenulispora subtropica TaxID=450798 RepID=A0ABN2TDY6_9ACTN